MIAVPVAGLSIFRSRDYELLECILAEPSIYRSASDDYGWDFSLPRDERCIYLLAQDDEALGFCAFWPQNMACYDTHLCFLPNAYGNKASFAFKMMCDWMWRQTDARRIVGSIPTYNRLALAFAERLGCKVYGRNPQSWKKHGKFHDQVLVGISRPEWA